MRQIMRTEQSQGQVQKLGQALALTQSMQTSIMVLQMNAAALDIHLETEVLENPFLETLRPVAAGPMGQKPSSDGNQELISAYAQPLTIERHLAAQIGLLRLTDAERHVADALVYCIDDNGFISTDRFELARMIGAHPALVDQVIDKIQQCEPVGVFARNLAECFRIQLLERNRFDALIAPLLSHLSLVADNDLNGICALCKVDAEDAEDMIADIRQLNPRPCAGFSAFDPVATLPDLMLLQQGDNSIHVELNQAKIPKILLNDGLFSATVKSLPPGANRQYYQDCYRRGGWLVAALQKRANTMLAVGQQLSELQRDFVLSGRNTDLVPLQMETIGANLNLNKSTISRTLSGRTIMTNHGVFAASRFFVRKANANLENKTIAEVLRRLKGIISTETNGRIYSDEQICEKMAVSNLAISRRAVSKYRKMLDIPNSSCRKRVLAEAHSNLKPARFFT